MSITSNENGTLYELDTITANEYGTLYEQDTVHSNENGTLYEIFDANTFPELTWLIQSGNPTVSSSDNGHTVSVSVTGANGYSIRSNGAKYKPCTIIVDITEKPNHQGNVMLYTFDESTGNPVQSVSSKAISVSALSFDIEAEGYYCWIFGVSTYSSSGGKLKFNMTMA